MAVVILSSFYKFGSWYHYYGGIIPTLANTIATVSPNLFYNSGLCSHSLVGINPL